MEWYRGRGWGWVVFVGHLCSFWRGGDERVCVRVGTRSIQTWEDVIVLVLYKTPLRHRDANVIGMPKPLRQENRGLEKECECELHCAPQHNYHSSSNPIRFKSATCSNSMGTVQRSKIEDVARSSEDDPSSRRSRDSIFGRAIDHTTLALVRHSLEGWGKGLEEEQLITFKSHIQFSYIAKGVQKKKRKEFSKAGSQPAN